MTNEPTPVATKPAPLIHQRIIAIMGEIQPIPKDAVHEHKKFRYRSIDALCNAIHDLLAKHQVYVTPSVIGEPQIGRVKSSQGAERIHAVMLVRYRFATTDGSFIDAVVPGEAVDNENACQQAMQFAYKIALQQVFNVASEKSMTHPPPIGDNGSSPAQRLMDGQAAGEPEPIDVEAEADQRATMGGLVAAFQSYNVTADDMRAYLGHPPEQVATEEITKLQIVLASIRDGKTHPCDHFGMGPMLTKAEMDAGPVVDEPIDIEAEPDKKNGPDPTGGFMSEQEVREANAELHADSPPSPSPEVTDPELEQARAEFWRVWTIYWAGDHGVSPALPQTKTTVEYQQCYAAMTTYFEARGVRRGGDAAKRAAQLRAETKHLRGLIDGENQA